MTHWIDDDPYPWKLAAARELHRRLVNTFFEPLDIRDVLVRPAGAPNFANISFAGSPNRVWISTLDLAAGEGALRTLLTYIVDTVKVSKPLEEFIRALLAAKAVNLQAPVSGKDGPGVADVTREEALLFGDDLTESVGAILPLLKAIEGAMKWQSAVCHLKVRVGSGDLYHGTGTLLTNGRVLTNHHVLVPEGQQAVAVDAEFNFQEDDKGQKLGSVVCKGDVTSIKTDQADDWGVIAIEPAPPFVTPVDLAALVAKAEVDDRAFILQHPGGNPKRLAFVRNRIVEVPARRVLYLTDTEGGSSGSPVFNSQGQLVALHRAGGTPVKLAGLLPVKKNEGVRLDVIAPAVLAV